MGDCASQPNYIEIENHVKYASSVNDAFFHTPVILSPSDRIALFDALDQADADSQAAAESYIHLLYSQLRAAAQRTSVEESKTKLVLETRKGIDIYPVGVAKGTYVKLSTAPCRKEAESTISDAYIPKWYSLAYFVFEEGEQVDSVTLSVYSRSVTGEDTLFGSLTLDLRSASDQAEVHWHPVTPCDAFLGLGIKPQLELRVWLIRDHRAFWFHLKESLELALEDAKAALARSRTGLNLSEQR